jgi:hypothetical protein
MTSPEQLAPLCQPSDVVTSLGLELNESDPNDVSCLPTSMRVRLPQVSQRVSRRFRFEAQRIFTPGTYTHQLDIHAGYTRLMEPPSKIERVAVLGRRFIDWRNWQEGGNEWVVWAEGGPVEDFGTNGMLTVLGLDEPPPRKFHSLPSYTVEGLWMHWNDWDFWQMNGKRVDVTYSWASPVPPAVVASVADIVARCLTVDPLAAVRQSKELSSRHFRQEVAPWVNSGNVGFTPDDIAEARSYRYPLPPHIIARSTQIDASPSQAFLSDTSW